MQTLKIEQSKIKCICSYSRVSTQSEEQDSSYLMQKQYWEEKLGNIPNTKYIGTFADKGSGRKIIQRKEFCRMIDLAKAGFIDEIYTKSMYRFARNTTETLRIIQELQSQGVAIIFEEENINTLTVDNQVLMNLRALFAEEEISQMGKSVAFMARQRYAQGIPDYKDFYGYRVENKQFIIVPEEAKVVQLIYSLFLKGYGATAILKQLLKLQIKSPYGKDIWTRQIITDILSNERYKGDLLLQKTYRINGKQFTNNGELPKYYVRNDHEPIIDAEVFDMVQSELKRRSRKPIKRLNEYEFTGKIYCTCGSRMRHKVNNKVINFEQGQWVCAKKDMIGAELAQCFDAMPIPETLLKEITLDAYNDYIEMPFELKRPEELEQEAKILQKLQTSINKLYADNLISINQYQEEKNKILERKKDLAKKIQDFDILSLYKKPQTKAKEYDKSIVEKHIEKIVIGGYKIRYTFKNGQEVIKEYKNDHRKYCKAYWNNTSS